MNTEIYDEIKKEFPDYFTDTEILYEKIDRDYYNSIFREKAIYVWGIGGTARDLIRRIPSLNVLACIDSNGETEFVRIENKDIAVILPSQMKKNVFCIVASIYYEEIKRILEKLGKEEGLDFLPYKVLLPTPTEMIGKMLESDRITEWECGYHMNTKRLQRDGALAFCMNTSWLNPPNGNVFLQDYQEIHESIKSRLIEISIRKGIYCFCNKNRCSPLRESIEKKNGEIGNKRRLDINCAIAAFDRTCNLHCESCRNDMIVQNDRRINYLKNFFIKELLPISDIINCAGEGEALFSKPYLEIFESCRNKDKRIIVLSNGTLADKQKVDNLTEITNGKVAFSISIDAYQKNTYESLRRGADFDKLMSNIKYIGEMVKNGRVCTLVFNYVISQKNYKEIPDFINMAKSIGASALNFTLIGNWGTFSKEEFERIRVSDDYNNPIPKIDKLMKTVIEENRDIQIFFRREYDFRNYINEKLNSNS